MLGGLNYLSYLCAMPELKLTNVKPIEGKTRLEVSAFLKETFENVLTTPDAIRYFRVIQEQGITIPTYYESAYSKIFTFYSKLVESDEERNRRLTEEYEKRQIDKARVWYQTLPLEHQQYVNLLTRKYIPRA